MPRSDAAFQQIRTERREQILAAAARIFVRKGLGNTTIADLVAAAGVSHGLIYRHFASKDTVSATLVEEALAHAALLARAAIERPGTPWDRLHWITAMMAPEPPPGPRSNYALVGPSSRHYSRASRRSGSPSRGNRCGCARTC